MEAEVSTALIATFSTLAGTAIGVFVTYKIENRRQKLEAERQRLFWKREERKSNLEPTRKCLDELSEIISIYDPKIQNLLIPGDIELLKNDEQELYLRLCVRKTTDDAEKAVLAELSNLMETRRKGEILTLQSAYRDKLNAIATKTAVACGRTGDIKLVDLIFKEVFDPLTNSLKALLDQKSSADLVAENYTIMVLSALANFSKVNKRIEELATEF